jgi:hypothetical protein
VEIRETSFNFPQVRGNGPQERSQTVVFPRPVIRAVAGITGYSIGFAGEDHHVGLLNVRLDTEINANVVEVDTTLGVRDWSGFWDDDYGGTITAAVLAELESATAPPARGDLIVAGAEVTQAIQSFRSATHLAAPNVLPDNAIPLVGGKTTGMRVWVDYDADAGLPPISQLSGELVVRRGAATTTLAPLATIAPLRETEIDRGQLGHTLNFAIPGDFCRGAVEIECRVFDAASPAQRSAAFKRTLSFVDVNPLRVYGVGIRYLGQGLNLPAPNSVAMLATLGYTRRTFPTGDVLLSGFTTADFDDDLATTDTSGCGDGFEELLDLLRDLRGDSDDLFYGLLPTGITFGTFIGCGGGGVGSGVTGDQVTTAHEAGHALGRKHAPCDSTTRCDNPSNQDDDYPSYFPFMSDSIGEYGYDPSANVVFDPAASFDFMGYSGNDWVSPYTYTALMAKMDPPAGAGTAEGESVRASHAVRSGAAAGSRAAHGRAEWQRLKTRRLFLSLDVTRDRQVTVRPSFAFEAASRIQGDPTPFDVELLDEEGSVLACEPLFMRCSSCRPECWPRHLLGEPPIDPARAARLLVYEDGHKIYDTDVPGPLKLECGRPRYRKDEDVELRWQIEGSYGKGGGGGGLQFIVHWRDEEGSWRAVAPRSTEATLRIPARLRRGRKVLPLRILATGGLATGECMLEVNGIRGDPPIAVVASQVVPGLVRAAAVDHLGRELANPGMVWYDADGAELVRGSELDLRGRPGGARLVRVVALNPGAGKAEREVAVDSEGSLR